MDIINITLLKRTCYMIINFKTYDPYKLNHKKQVTTKKQLQISIIILAGVLLIAASITFFVIYNEGNIAGENAEELLLEYEQRLNQVSNEPAGSVDKEFPCDNLVPTNVPDMEPYEGYMVIGKLIIDKIGQQLPVISETTTEALKVSCCYYEGPMPGEEGNLVITGHNYASGAIFGKLSKLSKGDAVVLSTPTKDYTYEVYETKVIKPDDVGALNEYKGDVALTLMTCMTHGNRRLLVYCKLL
jgi:LPXTG-site transpeptidase (sortase) family protein